MSMYPTTLSCRLTANGSRYKNRTCCQCVSGSDGCVESVWQCWLCDGGLDSLQGIGQKSQSNHPAIPCITAGFSAVHWMGIRMWYKSFSVILRKSMTCRLVLEQSKLWGGKLPTTGMLKYSLAARSAWRLRSTLIWMILNMNQFY